MSLCAKFHAFVPICAIHVFFRPNSPHYSDVRKMPILNREGTTKGHVRSFAERAGV